MTPVMRSGGSEFVQEAEEAAVNETIGAKMTRPNGFLQRFAKRDSLVVRAVDTTWWTKAQEGQGLKYLHCHIYHFFLIVEVTTIMCIYLSCLENHPNCTRESLQILNL